MNRLAACRSASLSSAVWRLKVQHNISLIIVQKRSKKKKSPNQISAYATHWCINIFSMIIAFLKTNFNTKVG